MTYEENVHRIAEEMAIENGRVKHSDSQFLPIVKTYYPLARIAVRLQMEAVRESWITAKFDLEKYLLDRGLIPAPVDTIYPAQSTSC